MGPKPNTVAINFLIQIIEVGIIICRDFQWSSFAEKYLTSHKEEFNSNWFKNYYEPILLNPEKVSKIQENVFKMYTSCNKEFIALIEPLTKKFETDPNGQPKKGKT